MNNRKVQVYSKSVTENLFGRDLVLNKQFCDIDTSNSFYYPNRGKNDMIKSKYESNRGQLPMTCSPKLYRNIADRNLPEMTFGKREYLLRDKYNDIPFYTYSWPIFDYTPIKPKGGNTDIDPSRFGMSTRNFTSQQDL